MHPAGAEGVTVRPRLLTLVFVGPALLIGLSLDGLGIGLIVAPEAYPGNRMFGVWSFIFGITVTAAALSPFFNLRVRIENDQLAKRNILRIERRWPVSSLRYRRVRGPRHILFGSHDFWLRRGVLAFRLRRLWWSYEDVERLCEHMIPLAPPAVDSDVALQPIGDSTGPYHWWLMDDLNPDSDDKQASYVKDKHVSVMKDANNTVIATLQWGRGGRDGRLNPTYVAMVRSAETAWHLERSAGPEDLVDIRDARTGAIVATARHGSLKLSGGVEYGMGRRLAMDESLWIVESGGRRTLATFSKHGDPDQVQDTKARNLAILLALVFYRVQSREAIGDTSKTRWRSMDDWNWDPDWVWPDWD